MHTLSDIAQYAPAFLMLTLAFPGSWFALVHLAVAPTRPNQRKENSPTRTVVR